MSELPPAEATPLRVTGTLFKDLVFAFEPQEIPDGARILRTLKRNGAIIMDEVEDTSIVLIDPELPGAPDLLREAASKIVLHYSWVNKSLYAGHPLVEPSNWGDCRVTPDNINSNFGYVPPPPPSNPQLQTPRPTPESRFHGLSSPSRYSQGSAGIVPPSSQPPCTPTPSYWSPDSVMLQQQQTPQLPPTNQFSPYNSQPVQPTNMFSPFPMSQSTEVGTMTHSQQPPWSPFHSGPYSTVQSPTVEDLRRAYDLMVMWFQRPPMYPQLPPPPAPTQPNTAFCVPPPPPTQNPPSTGTQLEDLRVPVTPVAATMSRQDTTDSSSATPDLGDLSGGSSHDTSALTAFSFSQPEAVLPPPTFNDPATSAAFPAPTHTHPKLFEHDVGKPIMFCVPIILKNRGKIAEIFRATGGRFSDDVEDADYVVLGQWEEHYFDEMWYGAQDCHKPTVTPAFVIDSYERGELMDPNNYPTRGPEKPWKDGRKVVRSRPATGTRGRKGRGRGGASIACPPPESSGETPKWLRFFKDAEHTKSLQYIGAMFKKNAELTHDALAIHLHNKMSNHTINSWKKYCLYRKNAIEDLRKRAVSNAEKKAISNDLSGTARETLPILHPEPVDPQPANPQQIDPRLLDPQPANPQQIDPQLLVPQQTIPQLTIPPQSIPQPIIPQQTTPQLAVPQPTIFQKTVPRSTILQRATPQPVIPQQATPQSTLPQHMTPQPTAPQQTTPQQVDPQPSTTLREGRPLPYEKVAEPEPVRVKTEPLDGDQLDFAFATELLSGWRPNEESDAELWKRMETIRPSATAPSWEAFCERHWSRFEHFFAIKSTRA